MIPAKYLIRLRQSFPQIRQFSNSFEKVPIKLTSSSNDIKSIKSDFGNTNRIIKLEEKENNISEKRENEIKIRNVSLPPVTGIKASVRGAVVYFNQNLWHLRVLIPITIFGLICGLLTWKNQLYEKMVPENAGNYTKHVNSAVLLKKRQKDSGT